jgi:hypothetical protein
VLPLATVAWRLPLPQQPLPWQYEVAGLGKRFALDLPLPMLPNPSARERCALRGKAGDDSKQAYLSSKYFPEAYLGS